MEASSSGNRVVLPKGWSISAGRESSWTDGQGSVVDGMVYTLTGPDGTTSGIKIPYSDLHEVSKAEAIITKRINALTAISG